MTAFLEGVRVVDLTEALAGPYCTAILADFGADVVKVERIGGDAMRKRGKGGTRGLPFEMMQRNKKSVAVDFTKLDGAEVVRRLAAAADIFVENFRPGTLAKYGLAHEDLRSLAPQLVYCSISGFGQTGPLREAKGVDLVAQGFSGLMSVTGTTDGRLAKAGFPVSDVGSGMWAAMGALAALERRRRTGEGAHVDVALTDAILAWGMWEVADYQMTGTVPGPLGTAHRLAAPYQAFECGDGRWVTLAAVNAQWPAFCHLIGLPELLDDSRFDSEYSRFENREALAALLAGRFLAADSSTWIQRLRGAGIPSGPVHDVESVLHEEQFKARGMFVELEGEAGRFTVINSPVKSDGVPGARRSAPQVGNVTDAELARAGYSEAEIGRLRREGVVG